jgi:hypothetical protein
VSTFDMLDGLLAGITREDIDRMPPVRRQRFTQALRRAIDMLERPHAKPRQEVQDGRARLPYAAWAEGEIDSHRPRVGRIEQPIWPRSRAAGPASFYYAF